MCGQFWSYAVRMCYVSFFLGIIFILGHCDYLTHKNLQIFVSNRVSFEVIPDELKRKRSNNIHNSRYKGHQEKILLFLHESICYGYSLEAPRRGASNEYPHAEALLMSTHNILLLLLTYVFMEK